MTVPQIAAIAHESAADGPLLLLGPSLGTASAVLWEDVIPILADRFRIVSWDLPGHGQSPKASEPFSLAEIAEAVVNLRREIGGSRAYYAGVSVGGAIGLEAALGFPGAFDAFAIVCSGAKIGTFESWKERAHHVRTQSTSSLVVPSAQRWFAPESPSNRPEITGRLLHTLANADDENYALIAEALGDYDVRDRLGEIEVPVIAIYGEYDTVTTRDHAEEIAKGVRNGRVFPVEDASHLAPAEQPAIVASALREFFA